MNRSMNISTILIISLIILISFGYSQELTSNILLGQSMSIDSKYLNETREVFINTPEGYSNSKDSYPVLYILDGETNFFFASAVVNYLEQTQRIPKTIVIGIPNTIRNRDFTPIESNQMQQSGGADNFISFLQKELIPTINDAYRINNYDILFGHSLCGMFSIYTIFNNPEVFNGYLVTSPYLMFENDYVVDVVKENIENLSLENCQMFVSIGEEPRYYNSLDELTTLLDDNETGLDWVYKQYEGEDHGSIPMRTIIDGLGYIFSDWPLTQDIAMEGVSAIKKHIDNRVKKYGINKQISEVALNGIGYQFLQKEEIDKAIGIFKYNIELYPYSSNVYDSLGDAYDAKGSYKKALKNYRKAVEIGKINSSPNLSVYKQNVEKLENLK